MKLHQNLFLTVLASLGLALTATSSYAQTTDDGYLIPANFESWVWTGTGGDFNQINNYDFYLTPADAPPNGGLAVKDGTGASFGISSPADFEANLGLPNQGGDILFFNTTGSTQNIQLSGNALGSGIPEASNFIVGSGFVFDLNGFKLQGTNGPTTPIYYNLVVGDGPGTANVSFIDTTNNANTATFANLTLGANGSSNNIWGGPNATVVFGSKVTPVITGNITIGDGTSTGNVFNTTAGQTFGSITVNSGTGNSAILTNDTAGNLSVGTNAAATINGGTTGAVTINGGSVTLNGSTLTGGLVRNSGALTITNGITINSTGQGLIMGSNYNLTISSGSSITSTGVSITTGDNTGVSVGTGSNLTVDGGNVSTQNATMTGDVTIQNGGQFSTNGGILTTGLHDTLAGTLNVMGAGSAFNGAVNDGTVNFRGQDSMMLATGAQISVTNGGSFTENANLSAATAANFNVDSSSNFNILGSLAVGTAVNITGGGTVSVGTFQTDGTVGINTGSGMLSVGALTLTGTTIGDHGSNVAVTSSLLVGNKSAMASGDTLEINGGVLLSGVGGSQALTINTGAVLSGHGTVSTSGANSSNINLNGGTIRVGSDSAISGQTLSFNKTLIDASGGFHPPTFEFSLYSDGTNDKLQLQFAAAGTSFQTLNLKLNLVGDLADFQANTNGDLTFTLFTDLNGNGIGEGSDGITLDSATIAAFAADGYTIDTSMLSTNGSITLDAAAVPEPSTWALMALGMGALISIHLRRNSSQTFSTTA